MGEVVFNTALTGYQEVIYDPSYWGQIVVMAAPHIGNTGVNPEDRESDLPRLSGFAARSFEQPSNWRSTGDLLTLLRKEKIPAFCDLDTRSLIQHLRRVGCLRGGIFPAAIPATEALDLVMKHPSMNGLDGASQVSCRLAYNWDQDDAHPAMGSLGTGMDRELRVAVFDYGVKWNILRSLTATGCKVRVFPSMADCEEIEAFQPDGLLLSNGPGDPAAVEGAVARIRHFQRRIPIFGICLGHQLLALANGGRTYKMKFGHRGINHPVADRPDGRILVTVHNHGFAVADDPLPAGAHITLRSLNDGTIEGLDYPQLNAFSVQFHPEASPGPHDASYLFQEFRCRMEEYAAAQ